MMKSRYIAATALAVVIFLGNATAGTYYVSPDGNNANPGTEALPWRTVQKAADTLGPGEVALIKDGIYHEIVSIRRSAITLAAYPGHSPVIDANGLTGGSGIIEIRDCNDITLSGLGIFNATVEHASGIWTWNVTNLTIENCRTYNTASCGMKINYSYNVLINGCEVERACQLGGEEDISIKLHSTGVVVSNNHVHHGNHEGIDVKEGASNVQVIGNYIHHVERQGLYADSWDQPTTNIEYRDNIVHDCGFGLGACAEMGGLLSNVRFINNLIYNCAGPGMFCKDWGGATPHPMQDIYYVNNTVYNCASSWGAGMDIGTYQAANVVVRNNIISQCPLPIQVNREPISKIIEFNLVENAAGIDPNWCIEGLPQFVDSAAANFELRGDSDAVDSGTVLDAPDCDMEGKPRPLAGGIDIGAYERALGDLDWNGRTDFADFAILAAQWQNAPAALPADIAPPGGNSVVNLEDLAELVRSWGF